MENDYEKAVKLFMVFDILGDTERRGPKLWQVERTRIEDVKNHVLDLMLITRLLKKYFPKNINYNKLNDYILCHDLPEALTGDITKFEGISESKIKEVTNIAIDYLIEQFDGVIELEKILKNYESKVDLESKIVNMIDKVHAATTFIKYQCEKNIDMSNPKIIPELKNNKFVKEKIKEGKDLGDILYEFHIKSVNIDEEELKKYGITRQVANKITNAIKAFAEEVYNQKKKGTLLNESKKFPIKAMKYKR